MIREIYNKLDELHAACEVNCIHQYTIDMIENIITMLTVYKEDTYQKYFRTAIRTIHDHTSKLLEIVDDSLPDYKIIKELEQLFDSVINNYSKEEKKS